MGQETSVLHYTRLVKLAGDKNSNLLGPFVSYKENEVLLIQQLILKEREIHAYINHHFYQNK